jgi:hypothetical protein
MAYAYQYQYEIQPERPVVVTVIAVLGFVFGGVTLLALPVNLVQMTGIGPMGAPMRPFLEDPMMRAWMIYGLVQTGALGVLAIIAAVGLLGMKEWARKLTIGLFIYQMVAQTVGGIVSVSMFQSGRMPGMPEMSGMPFDPQMLQRLMAIGMIGGVFFWIVVLGVLLFLLLQRNVREAFERANQPYTPWPAGGYPEWGEQPEGDGQQQQ